MGLKDELLSFLDTETYSLNFENPSNRLTAKIIAEMFCVKRNTVSHYLNQLVNEEKVIKVNTRPVYFISQSIFEQQFFPLPYYTFNSFQEILEYSKEIKGKGDIFERLIGSKGSLKKAIEQIKSSIYYPSNGLPIILCGPTGVGKSYTAELMYHYSIEKQVIPDDAPFISFNCAQYANNPELMSSNLFGYVKGAFTGADKTKEGMLKAADGGILFLDEVHRLNAEGQEKLFTFLDQGTYRRMGESEGQHKANVRIIFATNMDLEGNFLQTFLRRIPVRVVIPGLDERGDKEKEQFIYLFLIQEARKLGKPIKITNKALNTLSKYYYIGNIGDLKNTIKYISASSFAKKPNTQEVYITLRDLPDQVIKYALEYKGNKYEKDGVVTIHPHTTLEQLYETNTTQLQYIKQSYEKIIELFKYSQIGNRNLDQTTFNQNIINEIHMLFDKLIFNHSKERAGMLLELTTVSVQEIIQHLESDYNVKFTGNSIYVIAYFFYFKENKEIIWSEKQNNIINKLDQYVKTFFKTEFQLVQRFLHLLEKELDVTTFKMDEIFLTFYVKSLEIEQTNQQIKSIILAHGYATASSIANVANRLLRKNVFEAFDMPIDISVEDIVAKVLNYIEHHDVSKGLVILVDMGSLKDIYSQFKKHMNAPVAIINNVSTQMALFLGNMLEEGVYLEEIIERLRAENETEYSIIYPQKEKEKIIIASCLTGMGTAYQIQKLLESSIPENLNIKVIAYDYNRLKESGVSETIFQIYDVLAIVGTADPRLEGVHYLSLEDIISGQGEEMMCEIFQQVADEEYLKEINDSLIRHFSLERVIDSITILDSEKILIQAENFINLLEIRLNKRISNDKKVALYVHISCLVERLIRQIPIETYPYMDEFIQCQKETINHIQESFSVIEDIYNVKINIAEVGYIFDYLRAESSYNTDF
ncbi:sigma 54-interacting transcriptional regulator [Priestia filamentosa]|uniref:sigma 54-interacting transcriptional regulator n=1 Tax=Priestia filamentosa TaxID=1402861 RepID=UPI000A086CDA|nr:sigma-54-dependent transcriptional regulator [Priestia filamentosa]MDT3763784.1 sigma 54-interacting transcriptional regulator [Priestia filamentosa]OXS71729.1 Fis family transcriptional regulator [Priestia filamentosa]WRU94204.1 sigma 54-interacting transcriptional regulator [Priestia filamentosa]SMF12841.1 sigma-54 dependent transcriptional regulator, gfr operon transcriptional activator [Priestia filamentosa]